MTKELDRAVLEGKLSKAMEALADIEHQRWSHWQKYMHSKCERQADGSLLIPQQLVERWERQIATDYVNLTEKEKQGDRDQVEKYIPTIINALNNKD